MSNEDLKFPLKKHKKNKSFSRALALFFGCVSKNGEGIEQKFSSVSCQCQIEKDLDVIGFPKESDDLTNIRQASDDDESCPLSEEFQSSLKKLDSLISTLNNIHDIYKTSNSLQSYNDAIEVIEPSVHQGKETGRKKAFEDDVLKFNINFDKNTFIECQTRKGKHSLKIVHNSGQPNFTPIILHRCESEFILKKTYENFKMKASSDTILEKNDQLQRSYHTLSGRFGGSVNTLLTFKKNIIDHMRNIKDDVKTLRNILYYVEYMTNREKQFLPLNFDYIRRWLMGHNNININNMQHDDEYSKSQLCKYTEAKIRATNFCRFYTLEKKYKEKRKTKNVNKSTY